MKDIAVSLANEGRFQEGACATGLPRLVKSPLLLHLKSNQAWSGRFSRVNDVSKLGQVSAPLYFTQQPTTVMMISPAFPPTMSTPLRSGFPFACIFSQQYRIHMNVGNSKNYLGTIASPHLTSPQLCIQWLGDWALCNDISCCDQLPCCLLHTHLASCAFLCTDCSQHGIVGFVLMVHFGAGGLLLQQDSMLLFWGAASTSRGECGHADFFLHRSRICHRSTPAQYRSCHAVVRIFQNGWDT